MSSIIEMPELVLENIIGFLNFRAVFTLRQISRGICLKQLRNNKKQSKLEDQEIDQVLEVLKFILNCQKSILQELEFDFEISRNSIIFSKLVHILKSPNQQIQTERLRISGTQESQFLPVLNLIDSKTLEGIRILPFLHTPNFASYPEMDRFFETEHWKNSSEIHFGFSATNLNWEHFRHFSKSDLCFETISAKNLNVLKEFYINSSNFELSCLTVRNFQETENLSNAWGAPYEFENSRFWYFRMKNSKILRVIIPFRYVVVEVFIWFRSIEIGNVPQGAIIQD